MGQKGALWLIGVFFLILFATSVSANVCQSKIVQQCSPDELCRQASATSAECVPKEVILEEEREQDCVSAIPDFMGFVNQVRGGESYTIPAAAMEAAGLKQGRWSYDVSSGEGGDPHRVLGDSYLIGNELQITRFALNGPSSYKQAVSIPSSTINSLPHKAQKVGSLGVEDYVTMSNAVKEACPDKAAMIAILLEFVDITYEELTATTPVARAAQVLYETPKKDYALNAVNLVKPPVTTVSAPRHVAAVQTSSARVAGYSVPVFKTPQIAIRTITPIIRKPRPMFQPRPRPPVQGYAVQAAMARQATQATTVRQATQARQGYNPYYGGATMGLSYALA